VRRKRSGRPRYAESNRPTGRASCPNLSPLSLAAPTTKRSDPPAAPWRRRLYRHQLQLRPRRPSTQRRPYPSISRRAERSIHGAETPGLAHHRHQRSNCAGTPRSANTRCSHRGTPSGAASRRRRIFNLAARPMITTSSAAAEQTPVLPEGGQRCGPGKGRHEWNHADGCRRCRRCRDVPGLRHQ
jgi:hypothetical protein